MPNVIVERATKEELPAVLAVDSAHMDASQMPIKLERVNGLVTAIAARQCYVAREGWNVLGFAVLTQHFFGNPFIDLVVIHPDHRRKGIATTLIRHLEAICPGDKLFTSTNQSNAPMQALCERLGFVKSGWVDNLDPGDPELIYFKALHKD